MILNNISYIYINVTTETGLPVMLQRTNFRLARTRSGFGRPTARSSRLLDPKLLTPATGNNHYTVLISICQSIDLSTQMNAVLQDSAGDEASMYVGTTEKPVPKNDEVLIRVYISALNQMDLLQRKGLYPVPSDASKILGVEAAGFVEAVGPDVTKFSPGDRCMALLQGGGYAEYAVAYECMTIHAPETLTMDVLGSIPEQWITAYQLLFKIANARHGDSVLLHAASSGVGQAAIQLAKSNGMKVFATCRADDKVACCLALGADATFNLKEDINFADRVKAANGNRGVDVILDPVAASYCNENINCCAMDAKWVLYGLMGGKAVHDDMFLGRMMRNRISLLPSTLRGRPKAYKQKLIEDFEKDVVPKLANGEYQVKISSIHPMTTEGVREAHRTMASHANIGKIVLKVTS